MRRLDLTGERYGKLVALERLNSGAISRWRLKCDCGNETTALLGNIRSGQITSCGCAGSRTTVGWRSFKHGHSVGFKKSRTAAAWRNAKTRCFNKRNAKYPEYGGRGITMCKEWVDDFRVFLRDLGECPPGFSLERIDVHGNYEPGNCEWIRLRSQAKNKQDSIRVEARDGTISLTDFANFYGIRYKNIYRRIKLYGETAQQAIEWMRKRDARRQTKRLHSGRNNRQSD